MLLKKCRIYNNIRFRLCRTLDTLDSFKHSVCEVYNCEGGNSYNDSKDMCKICREKMWVKKNKTTDFNKFTYVGPKNVNKKASNL